MKPNGWWYEYVFNRLKRTNMEAHEFIRETFDLDNRTSISELPNLPISLIVEMLNNYKEGKVKKLLIPRVIIAERTCCPKCGSYEIDSTHSDKQHDCFNCGYDWAT